jgi:hypothetical protein
MKTRVQAYATVVINEIPRIAKKFNVPQEIVMLCIPPEAMKGCVDLREDGNITNQTMRQYLDTLFAIGVDIALKIPEKSPNET